MRSTHNGPISLTDANRLTWENAASSGGYQIQDIFTGTSRNPTGGKELYVSRCMNVFACDGSATGLIGDIPNEGIQGDTLLGAITADASAGTISCVYSGSLGGDEFHVVYATQCVSAGNMKMRKSLLRQVLNLNSSASPIAAGASYVAKFGAITSKEGDVLFLVMVAIKQETGQRRICGSARVVVVA